MDMLTKNREEFFMEKNLFKLVGGGAIRLASHIKEFNLIEALNNLALWGEKKFVSEQERTYKFQRGVNCHTEDNSPKYRMVCKNILSQSGDGKEGCVGNLKSAAFTLAEVLITLGIIGVVAALTLSMIIPNLEAKKTEAKLKKFYTVIAQATRQSEADNGDWSNWGNSSTAKDFYDLYYKNYLNVVSENYYDGIYSSTLYLVLADGSCIYLKQNWKSTNSYPEDYYWGLDTTCGMGPNMEGITEFELNSFNFIGPLYFCATGVPVCSFEECPNCKRWRNYYLQRSTMQRYCPPTSRGQAWRSYECTLKFFYLGGFTSDYKFAAIKAKYDSSYKKKGDMANSKWFKKQK